MAAGGVEGAVAVQRQTVDLRQRDLRTVELGDGDRAVEPHDRRRVDDDQLVVERDDL